MHHPEASSTGLLQGAPLLTLLGMRELVDNDVLLCAMSCHPLSSEWLGHGSFSPDCNPQLETPRPVGSHVSDGLGMKGETTDDQVSS